MTATQTLPALTSGGNRLDGDHLGVLRPSNDILDDAAALRARMQADGYLYLRGVLNRRDVLGARQVVTDRLAAEGALEPGTPPMESVARKGLALAFKPDLARDNPALQKVLYGGPMIELFEHFLGGPVRHFDYTWFRAVAPGRGTASHCDVVYMGRGTHNLYTAWTPIGDIDFVQGGLMILEGSNNNQRLISTYGKYDVDTFCENRPNVDGWKRGGALSANPNQIRRSVGGRWLTTEYEAGDVLVFHVYTVHASIDNHSERIRLSSDSRYQLASEPADERWIGPKPIAHGQAGKRGRIC